MKKMVMVFLVIVLALSLAGSGFSAEQTVCPVMGGKVNKKLFTDYKGERVFFCCPGCIDAFKKDPEKYLKKV